MYSKFPFSMENIPRQRSFACFSLKFGCISSGLLMILYSMLMLAHCTASLSDMIYFNSNHVSVESLLTYAMILTITMVHFVTLFLSALMLVGCLRDKSSLMRPWVVWMSILTTALLLFYVFWTAMTMINHMADSLLVYVVQFLGLLVRFYMLMMVASYYKQLEEEREESERLKNLINNETWYNSA